MNLRVKDKLQTKISNCFSRLKSKQFDKSVEHHDPETKRTEANQPTFDAAAKIVITINSVPTCNKIPRRFFKDEALTHKELTDLCNLLDGFGSALLSQISRLNSDAISSIGGTETLIQLTKSVTELGAKYEAIMQKSSDTKEKQEKRAKRSGAPTNIRAKFIAQTIAIYYKKITGKHPTVIKDPYKDTNNLSGPYYYLIEEISAVLQPAQLCLVNPGRFTKS